MNRFIDVGLTVAGLDLGILVWWGVAHILFFKKLAIIHACVIKSNSYSQFGLVGVGSLKVGVA